MRKSYPRPAPIILRVLQGPVVEQCPECRAGLIQDGGEVVCSMCGCVVDQTLDSGPESRAYDPEQSRTRSRVGAPMSLQIHDKGLSTIVGGSKSRKSEDLLQAYSLRKWQQRIRVSDATERNLAIALSEMSRLCSALALPRNILETASVIYRRAVKKRLIRGRSIQNLTAAAIYMSCRMCSVPRSLDEIAEISTLSKKEIGRSYRFMLRELGTFVAPSTNQSYAARFSNRLAISGKAEGLAIRILEFARQTKLTSGRGPAGLAAASTYIATVLTNERKTQREIAEIANVTEVTIRNRYKELLANMLLEVRL